MASTLNFRDVHGLILRQVKYLVTLLLVLSAFAATTAQSNIFTPAGPLVPPVNAALTITVTLSPGTGDPGIHVAVNSTTSLVDSTSPTGFDTACSISSPSTDQNGHSPIDPGTEACIVNSSHMAEGSFTIGNVLPGQYVIEVTSCPGNTGCTPSQTPPGDYGQAVLNVVSGPSIKLSPTTGAPGAHVLVNGTGFLPSDTTCALGAPGSNAIEPGTQACAISPGSGKVNASFTINNVSPGQYVIMVTAYPGGDSAQALLNVVSGPAIRLYPTTGQPGAHVVVNGTGFLPTDTTCALGAPGSNAVLPGTQACVIHQGSGVVNGSFTIGNVSPGQYVIMVTAYPGGDSAQALLNVVSGPAIRLYPTTGQPGAHVVVNGTGFQPTDTSCSISSSSVDVYGHSPIFPGTSGCVVHAGSGVVNGSFTVGNVLPGQYVIEITGCGGNNGCAPSVGDFAQALLNVVSGPAIRLYPTTGQPGAHVVVNGTGFLPTDTFCGIGAPGSNAVLPGTQACVVHAGSGVVNGSFTIGNVSPGQYVIQIQAGPGNDVAQALLNVVSGPSIRVYPVACGATGATGGCEAGAHVSVNGTGFLPTDATCALGAPGSNVIEAGTQACAIHQGSGVVNASFTIGNVLPGQYVIMITGYGGGDSAQAIVNVVSGPSIRVYPVACGATGTTGGCEAGAHVSVNGTGFLPTDTTCALGAPGSNAIEPGTQACVIEVGSGIVNASFTINSVSPGQYVIQITGYAGGDSAQAIVNVVSGPAIRLYPTTARTGAHILVNGTGFLPTDTSCSVSGPNGPSGTTITTFPSEVIVPGTAGCVIRAGTGVVNASFIISNVQPGQYVIEITGCGGNNGCSPSVGDFAQAILFVVTGPSLSLFPGSVRTGAHVAVNGTGFLPSDTSCILVSGSSNLIDPILAGTAACVIQEGTGMVNASFTVGNVPPGQYVIEVDASTPFIATITTTFSTSTTTTSSTSTTTTYTSTTNVQIDTAQALLNVIGGPSIRVYPVACGATGTSGGCEAGDHVMVNGTGFLPTDATCALGAPGSNVIEAGTQACAIVVGSGVVNASFTIGNVLPGQYVIMITGYAGGDSAQAIVNVVSGPSIRVYPVACGATGTSGGCEAGAHVSVNGTGFLPTDATCALGAPGSNVIEAGTQACAIEVGSGVVNGSFTIGNVLPGQYVIMITGYAGGDSAQAIVNVVSGPSIRVYPVPCGATGTTGGCEAGSHIFVNGTGFLPTDTTCALGAPGSNAIEPGTQACVIEVGSGIVNASFTINSVSPGQYVIQITGYAGGDSAQAIVNVVSGPSIRVYPVPCGATGTTGGCEAGSHIFLNGTGFLPTDTTCALGAPGSNAIEAGTQACAIEVGSGVVNGSFTIGNVLPGQYVIMITGYAGGDSAQAIVNVVSGPSIRVYPVACGATGTAGGCETGSHIFLNGTGFLPTDQSCSLSSLSANVILSGTQGCVIEVGSGVVNASFTIGSVSPGQYVIEITGCVGNNGCTPSAGDFAQALVNVVSGPSIRVYPVACGVTGTTGGCEAGSHIFLNGTGFLPTDTTCALGAPGSNAIEAGTQACAIEVGSGVVNASFTIGNVLPGQYVIQITGYAGGDSAQAIVNVVSGPSIRVYPVACGATGITGGCEAGAHIFLNGTGFLPTDTSCALGAPGSNAIEPGTQACVIEVGSGIVNASFTINSVSPGQYVIQITGYAGGDSAQAIVNVVSGPSIRVYPVACGATGITGGCEAGSHIFLNGTGFLPTDTSCALGAPGSNAIDAGTQACAIEVGSGVVNGSFTIGNVLPGQYVIQITGYPGGDSAQAIVNVVSGPSIRVYPVICRSTGTGCAPGAHILVNGTGFLPTDATCALGAPGSGVVEAGTQACVIEVGSGIVNASFTIGNVTPGQYVIQITGYGGGDSAQAIVYVINGPRLTLTNLSNPGGPAMIGQEIGVNGSGFLPTDQSCSISGIGNGNVYNPVLTGSAGCAIAVGTGVVNGSFIIGNVSPGQYVIEVTGCQGNNGCAPSVGDFAQAVLRVFSSGSTLTLSATNSSEESTVTFFGTGLSPSDTGCMLLAYNHATNTLDTNLITSPTCSITSPGVAQGTFIVSPYATTNIPWNLTVRGTPAQDLTPFAIFNVTADVIVTPTSGTVNTVFTFTGSGFSGTADTCTATIYPPFPVIPSTTGITLVSTGASTTTTAVGTSTTTTAVGTSTTALGTSTTTTAVGTSITTLQVETSTQAGAGCYVSTGIGQVSGSVIVPTSAVPGTYGIVVTAVSAAGYANSATGVFTVGTPSALVVLNPASVEQGQPVGAAGFGFNPSDAYCTVSSSTGSALFASTPTCQISGGYASAAFTVSPVASGGYYLISIIGCEVQPSGNVCPAGATLDFASNFLGVTLATTITTYSTTTSTSSTTTSLSTTTTSVATSFSYSSTTWQTTGILYTTFSHFVVTTVSGVSSTTYSQTSYTTQTHTTVTYSTTTQFTTVPCGPLPCGFSTQPAPFNPAPGIDSAGLLAALLLLIPMLLRRLFT